MSFNLNNFLSPATQATLRDVGADKIASMMYGTDAFTIKEAAFLLGAKRHLQRCERQKIAAGLQALAELSGEKVADSLGGELLRRAILPAAAGAGLTMLPKAMSNEPLAPGELMNTGLMGAAIGGLGGAGNALRKAFAHDPHAAQAALAAVKRLT